MELLPDVAIENLVILSRNAFTLIGLLMQPFIATALTCQSLPMMGHGKCTAKPIPGVNDMGQRWVCVGDNHSRILGGVTPDTLDFDYGAEPIAHKNRISDSLEIRIILVTTNTNPKNRRDSRAVFDMPDSSPSKDNS